MAFSVPWSRLRSPACALSENGPDIQQGLTRSGRTVGSQWFPRSAA